jgi:DMATS type aromatic prenyltransferase
MPAGTKQQLIGKTVEDKLAGLCDAIGQKERADGAVDLFREMWKESGLRPPEAEPRWSGLTDDSTPTEFSVVFSRREAPRLRVLFEPQGDPASPRAYWEAGCRMTRTLGRRWGASIEQALELEDIFVPEDPNMHLCMGHAIELDDQPAFKMYFNAMAKGPERAVSLVDEAFHRLGYSRPWNELRKTLGPADRIELFALDLTPVTRLKLYLRPMHADLAHITRLYSVSATADPNDVKMMWDILGKPAVPENSRPVFLTYQFNEAGDDRPSRTALSIPFFPGVSSDLAAERRTCRLLRALEMPIAAYTACVRAMADAPLSREEGIHSYVALQRNPRDVAVVAYFNPRLYARRYGWLARDPARTWPTAVLADREA